MKAARSNVSKAISFLGKTALAIVVAPLLPVIGLMWLVSTLPTRQLQKRKTQPTSPREQVKTRSSSRSLYAEMSNPALDITRTGDSFLNGY